jgi:hypothetical protein
MKALLSLFLLCFALPALAKSQPEIHKAKVISQNIGSYNGGVAAVPLGTSVVAVPINRRTNTVVLETPHKRITVIEIGNQNHFLVLPVNGTADFYVDGNRIVMVDSNNKKHKFGVVHLEELQTEAQK